MRLLIPGGAGYIGSHMVRYALKEGHDVTILDDFSTGHRWATADFEVFEVNLLDQEGLNRLLEGRSFDGVIHFAAKSLVGESMTKPDMYFRNNIVGTMNLVEAMLKSGCQNLVFSSTAAIFGNPRAAKINEEHPKKPINPYGRSKLMGEQAIKASGCVHAILRTSWVVSAHGNNFVKTMRRLSETRDRIPVVDDQIGGPTCARDIAQTCLSIAEQLILNPSKTGIYHYSGQPNVSWCQFANAIFEQMDCKTIASPIPTTEYPTPALRPLNSRLDCGATEDTFGIARPFWEHGLEEILRDLEGEHDRA